jgi:hypothetical protein
MRNFYTELDFDINSITFAKNVYSSSGTVIKKAKLWYGFDYYGYMWLAIAAVVLAGLFIFICVKCCRKVATKMDNGRGSDIYYDMDEETKKKYQRKYQKDRVSDITIQQATEEEDDDESLLRVPKQRNKNTRDTRDREESSQGSYISQDSFDSEYSEESIVTTKKKKVQE